MAAITICCDFQFSHSVVSNSLRPHGLQHARPPCPSPTPGVHSNSHPSSQWCHAAISSSVVPFSSCPQSLPASEYFPMSQLFTWGGQSFGVSALNCSFQRTLRTDLLQNGLVVSPCSPRDYQESSPTPQFKCINSSALSFLQSNSHIHTWPLEKPWSWIDGSLLAMSLLLNMLSRLVITFLPRSKHLLIFNFMAAVTIYSDFGAPPKLSLTLFPLFPHAFPMKWWDQMPRS